MKTAEIAARLVELCRAGRNYEAHVELYSKDIVAVEAFAPPGQSREAHGIEAINAKGQWWVDNHELHSSSVEGPWPHGDQFIVRHSYDITNKPMNKRMQMDEMALYTVRDGKIVREEFFYAM